MTTQMTRTRILFHAVRADVPKGVIDLAQIGMAVADLIGGLIVDMNRFGGVDHLEGADKFVFTMMNGEQIYLMIDPKNCLIVAVEGTRDIPDEIKAKMNKAIDKQIPKKGDQK